MAKTNELLYAIKNGQPSVQIHVTEVVEGSVKDKIQEMMNDLPEPIAESLKGVPPARLLSNDEVNVQDVPVLNRKTSTSKARAFQPGPVEKITEKQLYCIKESLGKRNLDETAFCQAYGVNHLEDLPKSVATDIVSEIKRKP